MNLRISTAPHIRSHHTTMSLMADVGIALIPCVVFGVYRFGFYSLVLIAVCIVVAMLAEFGWQKLLKKRLDVRDGSAALTGLLLALNLPPTAPIWMAAIGSFLAVILVKQLFGGIGDNFMNPALTARAILLASWPVHMTNFFEPLREAGFMPDVVSSATPLVGGAPDYVALLLGNIPGSIGEVSKLAILIGGVYMILRGVISWRIPVIMLASTALMSWILGGDPLVSILTGGVMFGAVFMATDYTTSPMTAKGQIVYAAGAGLIVAVIRKYGAYPEGVTYAILLMNIATPLIDKFMRPRLYGKKKEARENAK